MANRSSDDAAAPSPGASSSPPLPAVLELAEVVDRLRRDCPWDAAMDLSSMRTYLLEETHEVLLAMDRVAHDPDADRTELCGELGDLLFVVGLVARIMAEGPQGLTLDDAAASIVDKMKRRHPHVYGQAEGDGGGIAGWESRKAAEGADGRPRGRLAGVPDALPGLLRAHRQGEKAASVGFDWPDHRSVLDKVHEELAELQESLAEHPPDPSLPAERRTAHPDVEHELGDVLMALSDVGRHVGAPAESALRRANDRFRARFAEVERLAWEDGVALQDLDAAALDVLWERAKASLQAAPRAETPAPASEP